jgi:hypothetical protein
MTAKTALRNAVATSPDEKQSQTGTPHQYPPRFKVTENEDGAFSLKIDEQDEATAVQQLLRSVGCQHGAFAAPLVQQLLDATRAGPKPTTLELNFALQVIGAAKPNNELEAMLAAQMAAVHMAAMRHVRMLNHVETISQLEVQEKTVGRLMRTFALQMETLRKYRSGGEQRVIVKHVTVNEGGNAIVGNVETGGQGARKK